jgi:hypothetical protein
MPVRECAGCGAALTPTAGYCPTCGRAARVTVDLVPLTPAVAPGAPTVVGLGTDRHRRRNTLLALTGIVVAVGLTAAVLTRGDDAPASSSATTVPVTATTLPPPSTTPATATTLPNPFLPPVTVSPPGAPSLPLARYVNDAAGPVLTAPAGETRHLYFSAGDQFVTVDLLTGEITRRSRIFEIDSVIDGRAVAPNILYLATGNGWRSIDIATGTTLARFDTGQLIPSADPSRIWARTEDSCNPGCTWSELDVTGTVWSTITLPVPLQPVTGIRDGLLVQARGSILTIDVATRTTKLLGNGEVFLASPTRIVWSTCTADLACPVYSGTPEDPNQHTLAAVSALGVGRRVGPGGRYSATTASTTQQSDTLVILDLENDEVRRFPTGEASTTNVPPQWTADGRWVLLQNFQGRFTAVEIATGKVVSFRVPDVNRIDGTAILGP